MTVTTDKSIYLDGEMIVISGEVEKRYSGMPITLIIKSPSGNIVGIDQLQINAEKKYSTEITSGGSLMGASGTYTILVHYGPVERTTTFELITSDSVTSGTHKVADSSKSVGYEISGGDVISITPDVESFSLIISIDADENGSVTLVIPRTIFDAIENGQDGEVGPSPTLLILSVLTSLAALSRFPHMLAGKKSFSIWWMKRVHNWEGSIS